MQMVSAPICTNFRNQFSLIFGRIFSHFSDRTKALLLIPNRCVVEQQTNMQLVGANMNLKSLQASWEHISSSLASRPPQIYQGSIISWTRASLPQYLASLILDTNAHPSRSHSKFGCRRLYFCKSSWYRWQVGALPEEQTNLVFPHNST